MPIRRGESVDECGVFLRSLPRQSVVEMYPRQLGLDAVVKLGPVPLRVVERTYPNEEVLTAKRHVRLEVQQDRTAAV